MKKLLTLLITLSVSLFSINAYAEYAVIVNPSMTAKISVKDVARIYLAKSKRLPNGESSTPYNLPDGDPARMAFEKALLKKTPEQLKAYWATLVFTGKAVPILDLSSDAEVIQKVADDPSTIGYVDASAVNSSVRVVITY